MRKVPPSVMVREQIDQALFSEGLDASETNLLSTLAQLGLSYLVQQALEQEQEDFLGRGHYERRGKEARRGYRNGYEEAGLSRRGEGRRKSAASEGCIYSLPLQAYGVPFG